MRRPLSHPDPTQYGEFLTSINPKLNAYIRAHCPITEVDGWESRRHTQTRVATAALRSGFLETTTETSKPYRRFTATADQVRFRKAKGQRRVGGAAAINAARKTTATVKAV